MMILGYSLAGVLVGLVAILGTGIVVGLWFAVSATRPELLERRRRRRD